QVGAAPSELETQVTRKVEDAVAGIGNIEHIVSTVVEGASTTSIEFVLGTDTDRAVNDVRDAISRIRQDLPADVREPTVSRVDFAGGPFATYTVSNPNLTVEQLSWLVDDEISRSLLSVGGVGQVQRSGGVDRQITVFLDPVQVEALGLTVDGVNAQLRSRNIDLPGGRGDIGASEQAIRTLGSRQTLEQLRELPIGLPRGGSVPLSRLGHIEDGNSEPRQAALLNGEPVVAFSVVRSTGSSMVEVQDKVEEELHRLEHSDSLPAGTKITRIRTNAKFVELSYHATVEHLMLGAALAILVIWIFLKDWRAAAISAVAMPLSMIPTFFGMKALGYTLNNMSLLALALVIGILVDDAIVEVENIVRHIHMGKTPYNASLEAADEIGMAVVGTTFTIIAVFIPVAFMGGIPGQFFKQFGVTVALAVWFSLLVARLLTPMMCAYFMGVPPHDESKGRVMKLYEHLLKWALHHRLATTFLAGVFFVFGLSLFPLIPKSLIPQIDRGELQMTLEMQPGTTLEETTRVAKQLSEVLAKPDGTKHVFVAVGSPTTGRGRNGGDSGGVNKATFYVELAPRSERKLSQQEIEHNLLPEVKKVAGARTRFGTTHGLSGALTILLSSDDAEALEPYSDKLLVAMRQLPILYDVQSSAALERPELLVKPDPDRAAEQGVTVSQIARTAQLATLGDQEQNMAKFDLPGRQISIRVQLDPQRRTSLETLQNLKVVGAGGKLVPLGAVADIQPGYGPAQIDRYDRRRQVKIQANLTKGIALGEALEAVHKLPEFKAMPETVREQPAGDAEIQRDVFQGFAFAMGSAVLLIYGVLVLLYADFLHPVTIMLSLPLSIGGALVALILAGQALGLYALIGIVMLMGLVTKNAILLVDYCIMAQERGVPREEAVVQSGDARMRPILMTTVAMIAGMMPIAMGVGAGAEVRQAMAVAVIGGLITSTMLTLLVVPVVYTYIDDLKEWMVSRVALRGPED
ncbi:MAG: efflux RND transporter permease subunit, partial [Candidatus Eremiobacteraeota bacterium]|nr:efflux RND transporter permease subunit [Candidatus Eremiobacteraeota bacterium]